jgi:hypothetical protein
MAELLDKIPIETCWLITAKALLRVLVLRGERSIAPELGKGEGVIAPIMGAEKWQEIADKVCGSEGGRTLLPMIKEMFNLSVDDAIGGANLAIISAILQPGPEWIYELVETTRKRVLLRYIKCPWWEIFKENEINPELTSCLPVHRAFMEEGFKIVNPELSYNLTKAMPRGDPFCKAVIELK